MTLPTDYEERKGLPICTGVVDYFPDALAEVAKASLAGNRQHLNGQSLHWDKSKSSDEADALVRHLIERGTVDSDGVRHSAKVAWRALALLQRELDAEKAKCDCSGRGKFDLSNRESLQQTERNVRGRDFTESTGHANTRYRPEN